MPGWDTKQFAGGVEAADAADRIQINLQAGSSRKLFSGKMHRKDIRGAGTQNIWRVSIER